MNSSEKKYIKIGDDRIRLHCIVTYGIEHSTRFLVKSADMAEIDRVTFSYCYGNYNPNADEIADEDPIFDIHENPVMIRGKVARFKGIPDSDFLIIPCRLLYITVRERCNASKLEYYEGRVNFDIDEALAKLDAYFLK